MLDKDAKYIIKESAILFETNSYKELHKIILVKSPLKLRIKRVCRRDDRTEDDVKNIIRNQIKGREFLEYIDYTLNNNDELLLPKIIQLHKKLSNL